MRSYVFSITSETHCTLVSLDTDVRKVGSLAGSSVFRMYLSNPFLTLPCHGPASAHFGNLNKLFEHGLG